MCAMFKFAELRFAATVFSTRMDSAAAMNMTTSITSTPMAPVEVLITSSGDVIAVVIPAISALGAPN